MCSTFLLSAWHRRRIPAGDFMEVDRTSSPAMFWLAVAVAISILVGTARIVCRELFGFDLLSLL
jgi:hypothetical protein